MSGQLAPIARYRTVSTSAELFDDSYDDTVDNGLDHKSPASLLLPVAEMRTSNTLKLLFFICGLSTFARSESVLMQTQMFAECFKLGNKFYPAASSAIFMPGILIQLIQNRYDKAMDRRFTTYRAANVRILSSVLGRPPEGACRQGKGGRGRQRKRRRE